MAYNTLAQALYFLLLGAALATPSLSTFYTSPNTLNTARNAFCIIQYQQWVYAIGGYGGALTLASVERSTLTTNGTLGNSFETQTSTLSTPRSSHSCALIPPFIYVFGGSDPNDISSIERATVLSNGELSKFAVYNVSLPSAVTSATASYDANTGSLFIIGGYARAVGIMSSVYRASVDSSGDLSAFTLLPSSLLNARYLHRTIMIGSSLLVVGGNALPLEKAIINSDGSLSAFDASQASLLSVRIGLSIGYTDGSLFAVSGTNGGKRPDNGVEVARIAADGTIQSSFSRVAGATLVGRIAHEGAVFGNELVVIGGSGTIGADILNSVAVATISYV